MHENMPNKQTNKQTPFISTRKISFGSSFATPTSSEKRDHVASRWATRQTVRLPARRRLRQPFRTHLDKHVLQALEPNRCDQAEEVLAPWTLLKLPVLCVWKLHAIIVTWIILARNLFHLSIFNPQLDIEIPLRFYHQRILSERRPAATALLWLLHHLPLWRTSFRPKPDESKIIEAHRRATKHAHGGLLKAQRSLGESTKDPR